MIHLHLTKNVARVLRNTSTCEKSIRYKQMCMYLVLDQLLHTTECMMTDRQTYSYTKEIENANFFSKLII